MKSNNIPSNQRKNHNQSTRGRIMASKPKKSSSVEYNGLQKIKDFGIDNKLIKDKNFLYFLQQFIDSIPLLLIVIEPSQNYKVVLLNKHLANSLGSSVDKLIGKNFLDFFPPGELREKRKAYADRTIQNKQPTKLIDKRGDRYFDSYTFPVFDANGEVIYAIAMMKEITETKGLEKDLADKEQLFSAMIQHSKDMIYILTGEGKIMYRSPSAEKLLDYHEDSLGISAFDNVHPDDRDTAKKLFNSIISKPGETEVIQFRVKDAKGKYHVFEGIGINQLENPSIKGVIFNCRDITEKVKIKNDLIDHQKELSNQKNYLQNIIDSASEIIFTLDLKGDINTWNESAIKATGFRRKEVIGKNIKKINVFKNPEIIMKHIQEIFQDKKNELKDFRIKTKYGIEKPLKVSLSIIKEKNQVKNEILFICSEIPLEEQLFHQFELGKGYLIVDQKYDIDGLLNILLNSSFRCLYIGRNKSLNDFETVNDDNFEIINLKTNDDSFDKQFDLKDLGVQINQFLRNKSKKKKAVIVERFEYIMIHHSFETLIRFLYNIHDMVKSNKALLIIKVNKEVFNETQLKLLTSEFFSLSSEEIDDILLEKIQISILNFIQNQKEKNIQVNYKMVGSEFGLSKVTVKKHLDYLLNNNLLYCEEFGRTKFIHLTPKGIKIINKK
jgi:PAS domain S-box-containing protein